LIRRRYFSNELPAPSPWSLTPREDTILPVETVNDDDLFQRKSYGGQSYKYNGVAPLPAQRNLTPPPTLYPQQPMSSSSENYRYHRFSSSSIPDSGGGRTSRADINIWLSESFPITTCYVEKNMVPGPFESQLFDIPGCSHVLIVGNACCQGPPL